MEIRRSGKGMVGNVLKRLLWLGASFWKSFKGREGVDLFCIFLPCPVCLGPIPFQPIPKSQGHGVLVAWPSSLQKPAPHSEVIEKHV